MLSRHTIPFGFCLLVVPTCVVAQSQLIPQMIVSIEAHQCRCSKQQETGLEDICRFTLAPRLRRNVDRDTVRPGEIVVRFEADKAGTVRNAIIVQGVGPYFDAGLLEEIKSLATTLPSHCEGEVFQYRATNAFTWVRRKSVDRIKE